MNMVYVGLDFDRADEFGRRVGIALARGNWDQAIEIIAEARHIHETEARGIRSDSDPHELNLCDTQIPLRIIGLLEANGMFTIGDLLRMGLDYIAETPYIGMSSVNVIVESLREFGITRDQFSGGSHG
jgi:DNA-directed RNA polymerase alpha subunit